MRMIPPNLGEAEDASILLAVISTAWEFHEAARKYLTNGLNSHCRAELPGFPKDSAEIVYEAAVRCQNAVLDHYFFLGRETVSDPRVHHGARWIGNLIDHLMAQWGWDNLWRSPIQWTKSQGQGEKRFNPNPLIFSRELRAIREALRQMGASITRKRDREPHPEAARGSEPNNALERKTPVRQCENEDRDARMYDLYVDGIPLKMIRAQIKEKGWRVPNNLEAITHAVQRYAKRHGYPKPGHGDKLNHRLTRPDVN